MIVILMGVAGVGKSAVGSALAHQLGWVFHEGDDFHPPVNIEKMSNGQPLTDADRWPWLEAIRRQIEADLQAEVSAIVTCSALRKTYRDFLHQNDPRIRLVSLETNADQLTARLEQRTGHFFNPALLADQLRTFEPADDATLLIDAGLPLLEVITTIKNALKLDDEPSRPGQ